MKLHVDMESGPSPGIVLSGTKADMRELGQRLSAAADAFEREEGSLGLQQLEAQGEPYEWIDFRVVRNVDLLIAKSRQRLSRRLRLMPLGIPLGIGVVYILYRGLVAIIA